MRAARDEEMIWKLLLENQPRFLNLILNVLIHVNLNVSYMPYIYKYTKFYILHGSQSLY